MEVAKYTPQAVVKTKWLMLWKYLMWYLQVGGGQETVGF